MVADIVEAKFLTGRIPTELGSRQSGLTYFSESYVDLWAQMLIADRLVSCERFAMLPSSEGEVAR